MDQGIPDEMRKNFYDRFNELIAMKGQKTQHYTKETYLNIIKEVKEAKSRGRCKTSKDYQLLDRYDVIIGKEEERLIIPQTSCESIRYYAHIDEIFQILHYSHVGHKSRNAMEKEIISKYKNITKYMIIIYINQCFVCQNNKYCKKSNQIGLNDKSSNFTKYTDFRGQVDVIDMESKLAADDQYNFILIYQDLLTKFIQIRPLKRIDTREVASVLLEIMTSFGAPCILQSENGREFAANVVEQLRALWPQLEMVHGECILSQRQAPNGNLKVKLVVQNMLKSWQKNNDCTNWCNGLRFVQLTYNESYDSGLNCSPYEAMFGEKIKIGLRGVLPYIPSHKCYSEEDIETCLKNINTSSRPMDSENVCDVQDSIITDEPAEFPECNRVKDESIPLIKIEKYDEDDEESCNERDSSGTSYNLFDITNESFTVSSEHNYNLKYTDIKEEEPDTYQAKKIKM